MAAPVEEEHVRRTHQQDGRTVTPRDARAASPERGLFDFGPDLPRPKTGPVAAPPPWLKTSPETPALAPTVAVPAPRRSDDTPAGRLPDTEPAAPATRPATTAIEAGGRADHRRRRRPRRHLRPRHLQMAIAASIAAAVIAGGVAAGVELLGSGGAPAIGGPDSDATAWVLANLDPSATLLAPAPVSAALAAAGHVKDHVVSYGDDPSDRVVDGLCCGFLIVGGPADVDIVTGLPAGVQAAYDRSLPLATFVAGGRRAEIRQIMAGTPAQIAASASVERATLASAGRELVASDRLELSPQARATLLSGSADARVVQALVGLTGRHRISVSGFPTGPGENGANVLRRTVQIDRIDGEAVLAGSIGVREATSYLSAQVPPYRPAGAVPTSRDGSTVLAVTFPAPSPIGLLTQAL